MSKKNDIKKIKSSSVIYEIWLNLNYAHDLSSDYIADAETELKVARKHRNKLKKLRDRAADEYERLVGKLPSRKK